MALDMMSKSINYFRSSISREFDQDEIAGQIMFLPFLGKGLEAVIQAESELELETNILLQKRSEIRQLNTEVAENSLADDVSVEDLANTGATAGL